MTERFPYSELWLLSLHPPPFENGEGVVLSSNLPLNDKDFAEPCRELKMCFLKLKGQNKWACLLHLSSLQGQECD